MSGAWRHFSLSRHISLKDFGATTGASRHAVHAPSGGMSREIRLPTFPILPSRATNCCIDLEAFAPSSYQPGLDHAKLYILKARLSANLGFGAALTVVPPADPSVISARRCSRSSGISIFTGQTSRHAPHRLDAYGSCFAFDNPINCGVMTAPIGPG